MTKLMTKLMTISRIACLAGALAAGAMMVRADIASAKGNSHQSSDARSTKANSSHSSSAKEKRGETRKQGRQGSQGPRSQALRQELQGRSKSDPGDDLEWRGQDKDQSRSNRGPGPQRQERHDHHHRIYRQAGLAHGDIRRQLGHAVQFRCRRFAPACFERQIAQYRDRQHRVRQTEREWERDGHRQSATSQRSVATKIRAIENSSYARASDFRCPRFLGKNLHRSSGVSLKYFACSMSAYRSVIPAM